MFKLLIPTFLFFSAATYAQSISAEEAKSLANSLSNGRPDTVQINNLLKLAKYHIFKPGENKEDLDSAASFIKKAEKVNAGIKSKWADGYILLINSYLLRESGENEKAKESVRQAVDILKHEADKSLAGEAWFDYSGYYDIYDTKQLDYRIKLVDSAVSCFKQSGNLERVGASLHMLGDLQQVNGTEFIALKNLQRALDVYTSIHHESVQGIYSLMGKIYSRKRDYKKALDYELLALKTAAKVGDNSIQMCMINSDIGQTLSLLGENEKALSYHNKALDVAKRYKDNTAIYLAATNIASTWNKLNKPHSALNTLHELLNKYENPKNFNIDAKIARVYIASYSILKEYQKAEPYCNQLLNQVLTLDMNSYSNLYVYAVVVNFYVNSGQYQLATKYLHKHTALAEEISDLLEMGNSQKLWFMLDTARHDYRSAIDHLLAYKSLNDSLFNETKSHQISELQVQYETEKKEKDILLKDQSIQLLTKQDLLQKSKLQQGAIIRNIGFAVVILLIIIMALLYNRYRLKQRTNKKLESQQLEIAKQNTSLQHLVTEKEWLLKEIHHRVKNNFHTVMGLLGTQSGYLKNEIAINAIADSRHRIHAMSLIHQKLYQTNNLSAINMPDYIHELVDYLRDSFDTGSRINFKMQIERIELDLAHCIPLGLILNEAITNSIKYAFPGNREGSILISLRNTSDDHLLLSISDNGTGLPEEFSSRLSDSMGMNLMRGLSEEIGAEFTIDNQNGTLIAVSFVYDYDATTGIASIKTDLTHSI